MPLQGFALGAPIATPGERAGDIGMYIMGSPLWEKLFMFCRLSPSICIHELTPPLAVAARLFACGEYPHGELQPGTAARGVAVRRT